MMNEKILLVGDARICPQVAYVMDWQNYAMVERLSADDVSKYADHKIVICAFKRKSKKLASIKDKTLNIISLDDLCCELDKDYSFKAQAAAIEPKVPWKKLAQRVILSRGIIWLVNGVRQHLTFRRQFWLKKLPPKFMKPSELLLRVLYAAPTNIACDRLERNCLVDEAGNLWGCCTNMVRLPFGRIGNGGEDLYNSRQARIVKLSSLNRSYCLCDMRRCFYAQYTDQVNQELKPWPSNRSPLALEVAMDPSCNLKCPSCRRKFHTVNETEQNKLGAITAYLQQQGWLDQAESVTLAGMGEVFYSRNYRDLLATDCKTKTVYLLSNGTLFNQANWNLVKNKFDEINVEISVDAATPATYQKLRGWDFNQLLKNLTFISELKATGKIKYLQFIFVVQKDNYRELADFVRLSKRFKVDRVQFLRLNNWGAFTRREYRQKSLLLKNKYLTRELYTVLQDPIFNDPIVDLTAFAPYLTNSAKRYDKRHK